MISWIRSLFDRHNARHVDAGLDFEAELVARQADRKAGLIRRANRLDDEGLHQIAAELRSCAECMSFERPLSSLLLPAPIKTVQQRNGSSPKPPARHPSRNA